MSCIVLDWLAWLARAGHSEGGSGFDLTLGVTNLGKMHRCTRTHPGFWSGPSKPTARCSESDGIYSL